MDNHTPYARREAPADSVGGTIRRRVPYLPDGREPQGLSERALGVAIGACAVLFAGLGILTIALTALGV